MIKPKIKDSDGKEFIKTAGVELVIVEKENKILYLVFEDKKLIDIEINNANCLTIDSVVVGKIAEISSNIDAAFVLLPDKTKGYLKLNGMKLKCETSIPVKITRLASKGKLCSVAITDDDISHLTDFSIISKGKNGLEKLYDLYEFDRIITDIQLQYDLALDLYKNSCEIRLYEDKMVSLSSLFSVSKYLKEATERVVWLKSGANICIENTTAFTVIDVNSGKFTGKDNCYLKVNMEATDEIFRQMTLRNISGIILVDYINLKEPEEKKELANYIRELSIKQKINTHFIDITPLGIAEITRKKTGLTIYDFNFE